MSAISWTRTPGHKSLSHVCTVSHIQAWLMLLLCYKKGNIDSTPPEQNGHNFTDGILKSIFLNETCVFWFKFQSLFLRIQLTISQCCFRRWHDTEQATSHYLNQWWPSPLLHICDTRGRRVKEATDICVISCHISEWNSISNMWFTMGCLLQES